MCASKSELPIDEVIELTDFRESPRFPRKGSPPPYAEQNGDDELDEVIVSTTGTTPEPAYSTTESGKSDDDTLPLKSKKRLKFGLKKVPPDSDQSTVTGSKSSDTLGGTSSSPHSIAKQHKGNKDTAGSKDVALKTARGEQYSIAKKDASLLERISHKAGKRAERVRKTHEVFVELEELKEGSVDEELEWEETARWIKFEEDVDTDVGRWGRPHVSALAFHSLVEVRKGLEKGSIMFDVEGNNFPVIADKIVDELIVSGQLPPDKDDYILQALYKRHKHQHEVTLWDDLKNAAKSADGALHHLGDDLRHRVSITSTTPDSPLNRQDSQRQKLVINGDSTTKKNEVTFNSITIAIEPTIEEESSPFDEEKTSLKEESADEEPDAGTPNNSSVQYHHRASTVSMLSQLDKNMHKKLSGSMQDLLKRIPDEAESLTVLVGGVNFLPEPVVAFVRLHQSHLLGDLTEVPVPVRFIYLVLGPPGLMDYHEVGRAMATLMSDKCFHDMVYTSLTREELLDAMDQFLDDSIVLPPGDWDQDLILPLMHQRNEMKRLKERKEEEIMHHHDDEALLKHSRKPCGGILRDLKALYKRYPSDFKDMLHIQPFLALIFVYISCVAPAIAFGGIMEEVTLNSIGATETLVGTGFCGIVYGLLGVQPLTILAFIGPVLLFEEIIIEFSHLLHIEYLSWRAWIGLYVMVIIIGSAITEITFLVKYFTRFSEEIFTGVIALFFLVEASRHIAYVFERNPLCGINTPCGQYSHCSNTCMCLFDNESYIYSGSGMMMMEDNVTDAPTLPRGFHVCNQPNTALWSTLLCVGTFVIAILLRKFRESRFLGKQGRRLVSDFGMLTAIVTMVIISYVFRDNVTLETLVVSSGFGVSNQTVRGWVINPMKNLEAAHIVGATVPAALLSILIFVENQLTLVLINKPENKLRKGVGYHWDLLIVGALAGVCGVFGLPFHCAASVRSIQHMQALTIYSRRMAPGEKPKLAGVYEQRVTNIVVHLLIFLSPLAYPILRQLPFAVVLGVFVYLCYASLSGIQLRKRVKLFFTPPKHHPSLYYVRKVRTWKMNLYTFIQVVCVGILYGIKLSPAGMVYPLAIVLLIPLRKFLGKFVFSHTEIEALDSEEDNPEDLEEEDRGFAEYLTTHSRF